ncbi:M6 family metallopeptidase [Paractinoplanes durhamensis]|uniref:immune inhibitor A domain-containing protein n=1 Tax=Paractinoplanes durhamensis TaxID=113563 RepID=UPI001EF37D9C|nr:immune inhibitor A domain-containing protein [Actinoplanes durhamensis]
MASLLSVPASASPGSAPAAPVARGSDARELDRTRFTLGGAALPSHPRYRPGTGSRPGGRRAAAGTPAVGTEREWLGLDDTTGGYYPKKYKLRAVGKHIEVWVADDIAFPAADCRKNAVEVTDRQVGDLIHEFDHTIYPKETATFSTPPDRDGSNAKRNGDYSGDGDKTVTLIDNIRDDNYFHYPKAVTYVAGFFSAQLNELFDRNVMTIDAYDWKHRLGAVPADEPTDDLCSSRPSHPRMYESTFAHEWQHLLEYYADSEEESWVNEGLSDYAQTLVGYVDARAGVDDLGNDNHLICFQGFGSVKTKYNPNPKICGGPQNSLNLWDEGTPTEVLADYGNAYQFMLYLSDRFGPNTISLLHRDGIRQGLAGVQAALPTGTALYDVVHDYQTMTLVDKVVGGKGGKMSGVPIDRVTADSLRSTVNLDNPSSYDTPGAPPNGADYVPLPTPLRSVSFTGAKTLPPLPTGWTIADGTLFSGNKLNLDSQAVLPITVPAATKSPTLKLETAYGTEESYDWALVSISTDGGRTYNPVAGDRTRYGPLGWGLTGASGGVVTAGYDLKAYAGKKVLLNLHYVSDGAVNKGGWRIGRITLGDRVLNDGTSLKGWRSPGEIVATPVYHWHATLVGIDGHRARIVPIGRWAELKAYPKVVAIIAYDEPTEKFSQYAPYRLVVNDTLQPGGSAPALRYGRMP